MIKLFRLRKCFQASKIATEDADLNKMIVILGKSFTQIFQIKLIFLGKSLKSFNLWQKN